MNSYLMRVIIQVDPCVYSEFYRSDTTDDRPTYG
jgi:hypothetical protein